MCCICRLSTVYHNQNTCNEICTLSLHACNHRCPTDIHCKGRHRKDFHTFRSDTSVCSTFLYVRNPFFLVHTGHTTSLYDSQDSLLNIYMFWGPIWTHASSPSAPICTCHNPSHRNLPYNWCTCSCRPQN